jgi:hypothetical protein
VLVVGVFVRFAPLQPIEVWKIAPDDL